MYVDSETMPVGYHFTTTKQFVVNYKKMLTPGTVPKNWLGFIYIFSENYELDQNFDDTELKKIITHSFKRLEQPHSCAFKKTTRQV